MTTPAAENQPIQPSADTDTPQLDASSFAETIDRVRVAFKKQRQQSNFCARRPRPNFSENAKWQDHELLLH